MAAAVMEEDLDSARDPMAILPPGIISTILSLLSPEDVMSRCAPLNKAWKGAATDPCLWKIFCGETAMSDAEAEEHEGGWRKFFVEAFRSNLVKCPKFEDLADREGRNNRVQAVWRKLGSLQLESPPIGCPPFPGFVPCNHVVATSYSSGRVTQRCDLSHLPGSFLDSSAPISVFTWYGCRFDCGSTYEIRLVMVDASGAALKSFTSGVLRGVNNTWQHAQYLLTDYPAGVRAIRLVLKGQDANFWAGHYGSKFGPVQVRFVAPREVEGLLHLSGMEEFDVKTREYGHPEYREYHMNFDYNDE